MDLLKRVVPLRYHFKRRSTIRGLGVFLLALFLQILAPSLSSAHKVGELMTKRIYHSIYLGGNFYKTAEKAGKNSNRALAPFNATQGGGYFGMEMRFHPYIAFTDTMFLTVNKKESGKTSFLFGYFLGFRFYLKNPYIYFEQRIGMMDHFAHWDKQFYVDYAAASIIGAAIPLTADHRLKLDLNFEVRYQFYNTFNANGSNENVKNTLNLGFNIGITYLLNPA